VRVSALELGVNMNVRREDAEHFRLRVSTEEQILLRNIVTMLQANPDSLTLTRMQAVLEMAGRMLFDQFVKSLEEKP
jgi:phage host-nuclease inhibitor protein Gam